LKEETLESVENWAGGILPQSLKTCEETAYGFHYYFKENVPNLSNLITLEKKVMGGVFFH
jgi:hypothetical protein